MGEGGKEERQIEGDGAEQKERVSLDTISLASPRTGCSVRHTIQGKWK